MQSVLKAIAKQANLERILFSPGLKKLYFDLAVGAGGAAQFKHADSVRNGLASIIKDLDRERNSLLFAYTHELISAYDSMIRAASELQPVCVLAARGGKQHAEQYWSELELRNSGWILFYTHTLQELYDHLAIAYHIFAEKKFSLPVLIVHSALQHKSTGEWQGKEGINLGAPGETFGLKKGGTKSFADAFAALEKKKKPPTLQGEMHKVIPALREVYQEIGYTVPETGLPYAGNFSTNDLAVITQIPADDESDLDIGSFDLIRPLCIRPAAHDDLIQELAKKKTVAVIETAPPPGSIPPYYSEWCGLLRQQGVSIESVTVPPSLSLLSPKHLQSLNTILDKVVLNGGQSLPFHKLEIEYKQ